MEPCGRTTVRIQRRGSIGTERSQPHGRADPRRRGRSHRRTAAFERKRKTVRNRENAQGRSAGRRIVVDLTGSRRLRPAHRHVGNRPRYNREEDRRKKTARRTRRTRSARRGTDLPSRGCAHEPSDSTPIDVADSRSQTGIGVPKVCAPNDFDARARFLALISLDPKPGAPHVSSRRKNRHYHGRRARYG